MDFSNISQENLQRLQEMVKHLRPKQQGEQSGGEQSGGEQNGGEQNGEPVPQDDEPAPKKIRGRPVNNIYAPGTGKGTGTAAVRIGTRNRDGSVSGLSALGAATGPLSQPRPSLQPQQKPLSPAEALAQRQANVKLSQVNGTFDGIRDQFNKANPGQIMDANGKIGKNPNAPPPTKFDQVPDGQGGYKMVPVPQKTAAAPASAASQGGQGGGGWGGLAKTALAGANKATPAAAQGTAPAAGTTPVAPGAGIAGAAAAAASAANASAPKAASPAPAAPGAPPAPGGATGTPSATGAGASAAGLGKAALTAGGNAANAVKPAPAPARAPATFEGQSREEFFGAASQRQGVDNAYSKASADTPPAAAPAPDPSATAPAAKAPAAAPLADPPPATQPADSATAATDPTKDPDPSAIPEPKAKGGPVQAGRPYLVGEKGPEIIVPKQSGTVVPNHALKAPRQTKGLFMQARPVPAAFAREMASKLRHGRGYGRMKQK